MTTENADEKLSEAHAMMTGEMERMKHINETLLKTSKNLEKTADEYDEYSSKLGVSKRYLREIRKRVQYQDLAFYISFWIFIGTCIMIANRRIPLITFAFWCVQTCSETVIELAFALWEMFPEIMSTDL